jgi:hypothetical protein
LAEVKFKELKDVFAETNKSSEFQHAASAADQLVLVGSRHQHVNFLQFRQQLDPVYPGE